jgi:hypothetical protein
MGATVKYHPVSIPLIRHSLSENSIVAGKFHQVVADFEKCTALYDVTIKHFPAEIMVEDLLNPREVKRTVQKALGEHHVGWGWMGYCEGVAWRNGHWVARIKVELIARVAK